MNESQLLLLKKAAAATEMYITTLLNPTEYDNGEPGIASGTFVIIGDTKGIVTNAHVLNKKENQYVQVPSSKNYSPYLRKLAVGDPIILDYKESMKGVDIAFLPLIDNDIDTIMHKLGKVFWNLDQSFTEWKLNNNFLYDDMEYSGWIIHGYVAEGAEYIEEVGKSFWFYPNSGPYGIVPDLNDIRYAKCKYKKLKIRVEVDNLVCPIKTLDSLPVFFNGMSGGAAWKIVFDKNEEIKKIIFGGIATEQLPADKPTMLICRDPVTLYNSFYPFCVNKLKSL